MRTQWLILGTLALSCTPFALSSCGDDTGGGGTPSDASPDSTTHDAASSGSAVDSATPDSPTADSPTADAPSSDGPSSDAPVDAPSEASACVLFDAGGLDDAAVAAGFLEVWQTYKCASCHQKPSQKVDDAGAGIVLSGNNDGLGDSGAIFPPNLTSDPTGIGCWTNDQVQTSILKGTLPDGGTMCVMPKFGNASMLPNDGGPRPGTPMDAGTAQEIIAFLRSLPPVSNQVMSTRCPVAGDAGTDASSADGAPDAAPDAGTD